MLPDTFPHVVIFDVFYFLIFNAVIQLAFIVLAHFAQTWSRKSSLSLLTCLIFLFFLWSYVNRIRLSRLKSYLKSHFHSHLFFLCSLSLPKWLFDSFQICELCWPGWNWYYLSIKINQQDNKRTNIISLTFRITKWCAGLNRLRCTVMDKQIEPIWCAYFAVF